MVNCNNISREEKDRLINESMSVYLCLLERIRKGDRILLEHSDLTTEEFSITDNYKTI